MNLRLCAMAALLGALSACAIPKVMLSDGFVPNTSKVARSSVKVVGQLGTGQNSQPLQNYYIQVCDVQGTTATNCKTSLILENITNYAGVGAAYVY